MNVKFKTRAFADELAALPLDYIVERYSSSVFGGPKMATIRANGRENDLWELVEMLRCHTEIWTDVGDLAWWGYISDVQLRLGSLTVGVSIDSMYNKIEVAYTYVEPGLNQVGERRTTAWAQDDISVAEYGIRELLLTISGSTDTHALSARDMALAQKRYPRPTMTFGDSDGSEYSATITCRGYYGTLDWRYYSCPAGLEVSAADGNGEQAFGAGGATPTRVAQGFTVSSAWILKVVDLRVKITGTPADNLRVDIFSDSSGAPGSSLTYGWTTGSALPEEMDWVVVEFVDGGQIQLAASTPYWIVISRDGSPDAANYYTLDVTEGLEYTNGALRIEVASAWGARDPDADLNFRLASTEDTAIQAAAIALTSGQFFTGVICDVTSGILTGQYRDGDGKALYELEELLKMGTSNKRRMLATVDQYRIFRITEEPLSTDPYLLTKDGILRDPWDNPVRRELCPVGVWMKLKDVIPSSVDTTKLADPSLAFIDEAEYDVATDRLSLLPRDLENPWDLGRPSDG